MLLAPRSVNPLPNDLITFTVEVDRSACLAAGNIVPSIIEQRLQYLEKNGFVVSKSLLYSSAACLFQSQGKSTSQPNVQQAAMCLETWKLNVVSGRLVAIPPANDANQTLGTQLLGVGVGLRVACQLYNIKISDWITTRNNNTYDHNAVDPMTGGKIELEIRGRYNHNGWPKAIQQANTKLNKRNPRHFQSAAAILFAPHPQTKKTTRKDILIMDPTGNEKTKPDPHQRLRNLMSHYAQVLKNLGPGQGPRPFVTRLQELSQSDEETFVRYLKHGKDADENRRLYYDPRPGMQDKPWRTFFRYDEQRFCGTDFENVAWPFPFADYIPRKGQGAFFFGLWEPIIEALRDGRVREIADMTIEPITSHYEGKIFVLQEDGVALAWASDKTELKPGMFDGLFIPPPASAVRNGNGAKVDVPTIAKENAFSAKR